MERKKEIKNELHIGPQINCADNIGSIEINDNTNIICNCSKVTNQSFCHLAIETSPPKWCTRGPRGCPLLTIYRFYFCMEATCNMWASDLISELDGPNLVIIPTIEALPLSPLLFSRCWFLLSPGLPYQEFLLLWEGGHSSLPQIFHSACLAHHFCGWSWWDEKYFSFLWKYFSGVCRNLYTPPTTIFTK